MTRPKGVKFPRGTVEETKSRKQQFGMWLGLPPEARVPPTQEELAAQLEVNTTTLAKWKKDIIVIEAKENAVKLFFTSGPKMAEFMDSIDKGLKKGTAATQRLFAEMAGLVGKGEGKMEPVEITIKSGIKTRS